MRVIMVGPDRLVQGGISGVVNNWYKAQLDHYIELLYIGTMVDGNKLKKLLKAIQAYVIFTLRVKNYDIVHINMATDASYYRKLYFIKFAKLLNKKVVIHQHGGDVQRFFKEAGSEKSRKKKSRNLDCADVFIVLAPIWKQFFSEIVSKDKLVVLPNGIPIPQYDVKQKDYGNHNIAYIGRLCEEKGIKELFCAVESIRSIYPDVNLHIGGRWEDEKLKEYYENNRQWIKYLGWLNDDQKQKLLEKCSVFVMPSYFEGQCIAVLEAMAYGCAPIVTRVGGLQQTFDEGKDGLLIEPKNVEQLAYVLDVLMSDVEKKKQIGYEARKKVQERFELNIVTERLISIYKALYAK